tara:strand:+ start:876 stop:1667 length:792 start_codon:yes stop_codon:yes gene_type:complete
MKKPVIVTSLFDIGRDTWETFTVSYHTYLWWMKNTLSLDAKFVIYTDNRFHDKIVEMRKEFDPGLSETKVIKTYLHQLPSYLKYNRWMETLMHSEQFKSKIQHQVPEMTKPLYNTVIFNKLDFVKDAKDNNYFDGDLFIWVDAGGLRDDINLYKGTKWPNLKTVNDIIHPNKVTFFSHRPDFSIVNKEDHALSQIRYIQGGSVFCPPSCIDPLHTSFNETVKECLTKEYIGSEEKMLDLTFIKDKKLYNLIACDWREYYNILK